MEPDSAHSSLGDERRDGLVDVGWIQRFAGPRGEHQALLSPSIASHQALRRLTVAMLTK
jgi:hypothetical protein